MVHPFLFVTRFGETDNSYRLSWVKHKLKNAVKQEKSAFYRIFLLFIDVKYYILLFINVLRNTTVFC
jgi:hypothetical protein